MSLGTVRVQLARLVVMALAAGGGAAPVGAQVPGNAPAVPPVFVVSEKDVPELAARCAATHAPAIAAAQTALRRQGVAIASQDDYIADRALNVYIVINGVPVTQGCATNVRVSLQTYTTVINPVTRGRHRATIAFCDQSVFLTGGAGTFQQRINGWVAERMAVCVDRYRKSIR